jgi:secondary thiamine-phosphate synthase enzyme
MALMNIQRALQKKGGTPNSIENCRNRNNAMSRLAAVSALAQDLMVAATLVVETRGQGFFEITKDAQNFVSSCGAGDGILFLFIRHTSASLVIQENADPDVRTDLGTALDRLAPADARWVHDVEGSDDMPAHVKTMLTGVSLHIPFRAGRLALGNWQGVYVAEHRTQPHRRELFLHYIGAPRGA